jgi:putative glycosyltransferase (TIGR04372 family)
MKARILKMVPEATLILGYNSDSPVANSHLVTRYLSDFVEFCEPSELGTTGAYLPDPIVFDGTIFPNNHGGLAVVQQRWESSGRGPLFRLKPDDEEFGRSELARLGMPGDAWFVTMHARTPAFKNAEAYRDVKIDTFMEAVRLIIAAGGWVVRIGSDKEPSMPSMKGLIDYTQSSRMSARMDIFLMAGASLFLGSGSGPATIAEAFGVPLVLTNYLPTATLYQSRQTLFIPRLMQYLDGKGLVHFDVTFNSPLNLGVYDMNYLQNGVGPVPNTGKEIADVVEQALYENKLLAPKESGGVTCDSSLGLASEAAQERQERFKELCLRNNVLLLPREVKPFAPLARIGDSFLADHQVLMS